MFFSSFLFFSFFIQFGLNLFIKASFSSDKTYYEILWIMFYVVRSLKNCLFCSVSFSGLQSFCGVSSSNLLFFVDNFVDVMIKYYLMIKYSSCLVLILFKKILFFPCLFFSTPSMICREFGNKIASHFVIRSAPF